jgi:hypothetical protein
LTDQATTRFRPVRFASYSARSAFFTLDRSSRRAAPAEKVGISGWEACQPFDHRFSAAIAPSIRTFGRMTRNSSPP